MRWQWVLLIVLGAIAVAVLAGFVGRALVRRGMKRPWAIRVINRLSERIIDLIKKPITIAVLDEVAYVLEAGHYTQSLAAALRENEVQIRAMIAEKVAADPTTRHLRLLPFHDQIVAQTTDTTLRIVLEVLADPRTDELVSDVLRNNLEQLRDAVHAQQPEILPFGGPEVSGR